MCRRNRSKGCLRLAPMAMAFAVGAATSQAAETMTNVRLANSSHRFAVALALEGAARQLSHPECEALVDEFKSGSARPLREGLAELGMSPSAYIHGRVFFYDAPERLLRNLRPRRDAAG